MNMAAVKHGPKHVDRNEVDRKVGKISVLLSLLVRALWLVLAISWPILRWLLAVFPIHADGCHDHAVRPIFRLDFLEPFLFVCCFDLYRDLP